MRHADFFFIYACLATHDQLCHVSRAAGGALSPTQELCQWLQLSHFTYDFDFGTLTQYQTANRLSVPSRCCRNDLSQQSAEVEKQRRQLTDAGRTATQLAKQKSDLAHKEADLQVRLVPLYRCSDCVNPLVLSCRQTGEC